MAKHQSESEPTVRNIVIIGRTGLEKTVANHIVGQELEEKTLVSGVAVKGVHEAVDVLYRIAIYDTTDGGLDNMGASDLSDVHLVLFVIQNGRFTRKDKDIIDSIFECLEKCVSQISALVLIGCEGKDDTLRHSIVKDFSDASSTKYVADFMGQNIYGVGFVDISEIKEELREEYEKSMKEDEKTLRDLVMKQSKSVEVRKMLKPKMPAKREVQVEPKPKNCTCTCCTMS